MGLLAAMVLAQSEMSETEVQSMLEAFHKQTYKNDKPDPAWICVSTGRLHNEHGPACKFQPRCWTHDWGCGHKRGLGMTKVTMSYQAKTGRIHAQTADTLEDDAVERLKDLDAAYSAFLKTGEAAPPPPGGNVAVNSFRRPAYSDYVPPTTGAAAVAVPVNRQPQPSQPSPYLMVTAGSKVRVRATKRAKVSEESTDSRRQFNMVTAGWSEEDKQYFLEHGTGEVAD